MNNGRPALLSGMVALKNTLPFLYGNEAQVSTSSGSYVGHDVNTLDASLSNSVYTDSGKVYPLSLALNFIIKA